MWWPCNNTFEELVKVAKRTEKKRKRVDQIKLLDILFSRGLARKTRSIVLLECLRNETCGVLVQSLQQPCWPT